MLFWKKGTSPANEFILHEQKEKAKMHFFFFKFEKNVQITQMSFPYINVEIIKKCKK